MGQLKLSTLQRKESDMLCNRHTRCEINDRLHHGISSSMTMHPVVMCIPRLNKHIRGHNMSHGYFCILIVCTSVRGTSITYS